MSHCSSVKLSRGNLVLQPLQSRSIIVCDGAFLRQGISARSTSGGGTTRSFGLAFPRVALAASGEGIGAGAARGFLGGGGGTISKPLLMWFLKSPIELWSNLQRASTLFTKGFDTENVSPGGSASNSSATTWRTAFLCALIPTLKGTPGKVSIVVLTRFAGGEALSEELPEPRPRPRPRPLLWP